MNRYFGLHTLEGEWHALLPRYLCLAERIEGKRILDVGCGSGLGASLLLELGALMVDAIDHRPAVLELAKMKHAKPGLDFHVMLWEDLTFPDDTFDIILCLDPSSPVTDPNLLREVRRVLKNNGEYICGVEKTTVHGLESILPRYGYNEVAQQVDLQPAEYQVPQIGEVSRYFERIYTLRQRPRASFLFRSGSQEELDEKNASLESDSKVSPRVITQDHDVDYAFNLDESHVAGVELWFCGATNLEVPKTREITLPYYSLSERIQQMFHTMQVERHGAQRLNDGGTETPFFDALLEEGTEIYQDTPPSSITREFYAPEHETTGIHVRPINSGKRPDKPQLQLDQLDAHLAELDALGRRFKTDFERLLFEARESLDERDGSLLQAIETLNQRTTIDQLQARISQLEEELATYKQPNETAPSQEEDTTPKEKEAAAGFSPTKQEEQ